VRSLAAEFLTEPMHLNVGSEGLSVNKDITQEILRVDRQMESPIVRLMEVRTYKHSCVHVNTRTQTHTYTHTDLQ
jgi:superfamily II DNA/RNA helicase